MELEHIFKVLLKIIELLKSGFITVMSVLLLLATRSLGMDGGYVEIANVRSQFNCGGNMW